MKTLLVSLALIPALAFAQSQEMANELVVVSSAAARTGSTTISLDFVNPGSAAAIQFEVDVGVNNASQVDLTGCLSSFKDSGRMISCTLVGSKVVGLIVSPSLKNIAAGQVNLGTITVNSANAKVGNVMWEAYDVAGKALSSKVTNASADSVRTK